MENQNQNQNKGPKMNRRKFLTLTASLPVVLGGVGSLSLLGGTLNPPESLKPLPPKMAVAKETDVTDAPLEFVYDGSPAMLFSKDGAFLAFSRVCSHLGCIVAWNADTAQFECPCHGGIYNADGDVIKGPPPKPLQRLTAWVEEGVVMVQYKEV